MCVNSHGNTQKGREVCYTSGYNGRLNVKPYRLEGWDKEGAA